MQTATPVLIFAGLALLYALPGVLAVLFRRPSHWAILAFNLLLGWTALGWVGALVLAFKTKKKRLVHAAPPSSVHQASASAAFAPSVGRMALMAPPPLDPYADWLDLGSAWPADEVEASATKERVAVHDSRRRPAPGRRAAVRPDTKKTSPLQVPGRAALSNRQ